MLQSLIGNIDNLNAKSVEELAELVDRYPYCQSIHLLYAVALANIHSTKLNAQVQRAAIAMPDRLKLCQMVSKGEYEWFDIFNDIEHRRKKNDRAFANDDFMLIERYLDNIGEPSTDALLHNIASTSIPDYDWDNEDPIEKTEFDEQDALIENFIEAEEKGELFVPKAVNTDNSDSSDENDISLKKIREKAFLSESLAKLYVKQHKYEQALSIFSTLNLKYSKKFTYFADQIRYLETVLSYQKGEDNK